MRSSLLLLLCIAALMGCGPHKQEVAWVPSPQPSYIPSHPEPKAEGSLWTEEGGRNYFFVDRKARWLNDVVTVKIVEVNEATKKASTENSRESHINALSKKANIVWLAGPTFCVPKALTR